MVQFLIGQESGANFRGPTTNLKRSKVKKKKTSEQRTVATNHLEGCKLRALKTLGVTTRKCLKMFPRRKNVVVLFISLCSNRLVSNNPLLLKIKIIPLNLDLDLLFRIGEA